MGRLAAFRRTGKERTDDVWSDDGRVVDLYRSQGIVQGTYETYAAAAVKHFGGSLRGTLNVTAGLGGMGGAQPLAITMNEGVALIAEVEEWRIDTNGWRPVISMRKYWTSMRP